MKVISVEAMRELDRRTIQRGTPGFVLMERAGAGACHEMWEFLRHRLSPRHRRRFAVLAGKGNNGGDAYVVARLIAEDLRLPVTVYAVCDPNDLSGDAHAHAKLAAASVSIQVARGLPPDALAPGTVLVDGLLGTGASGPLRPPYSNLVEQINASGLPVVSLDVPSGMNGNTGRCDPCAVVADLTVTMGLPKAGLVAPAGLRRCGALRCVDIGIPDEFVNTVPAAGLAVFRQDVEPLLRRRPADGHKGTFGHCLVVAGSSRYGGAPRLAAAAALRAGAGLVTLAVPQGTAPAGGTGLSALIRREVPGDNGSWSADSLPALAELVEDKQAIAFGPGIGRQGDSTPVLNLLLEADVPLLVDADGLRVLAGVDFLPLHNSRLILTPHPGEMRQLLNSFELGEVAVAPRHEQALALASRTGGYVVLKGLGTIMASPGGEWAINTSGGNGLATAGTGDVLAGLLTGLLAQGFSAWDAIRAGVFIHGLAGELAPVATRALVADDLLQWVSDAFRETTPFA